MLGDGKKSVRRWEKYGVIKKKKKKKMARGGPKWIFEALRGGKRRTLPTRICWRLEKSAVGEIATQSMGIQVIFALRWVFVRASALGLGLGNLGRCRFPPHPGPLREKR